MATPRAQLTESLLVRPPAQSRSPIALDSPLSDTDESQPVTTIVHINTFAVQPRKKTPYSLSARIYIVILLLESFVLLGTAICALISVYTCQSHSGSLEHRVECSTALVALRSNADRASALILCSNQGRSPRMTAIAASASLW